MLAATIQQAAASRQKEGGKGGSKGGLEEALSVLGQAFLRGQSWQLPQGLSDREWGGQQ